jgi:hypothetical protein
MNTKYSEKMSSNPDILGKAIATWWFKRNNELGLTVEDEAESTAAAVRVDSGDWRLQPKVVQISRALSEVRHPSLAPNQPFFRF